MDNLNLITSDFTFSGNFDGCLPQKVGVSAPVLKRNDPVLWYTKVVTFRSDKIE